jgi:hypothetical protein
MPKPYYTVTFDTVAPGIALSSAEADKLRASISLYTEGTNAVFNGTVVKNFKFKDDRGVARYVDWKVNKEKSAGRNLSVTLIALR